MERPAVSRRLRTTDFLRDFSWEFHLLSEFLPDICWEEIRQKNIFRTLFRYLGWGWNPGFTSNKPTHYLLDYGINLLIYISFSCRVSFEVDCIWYCREKIFFYIKLASIWIVPYLGIGKSPSIHRGRSLSFLCYCVSKSIQISWMDSHLYLPTVC